MLEKRSAAWWIRRMRDNWSESYDPVIEVSTCVYRLHEILREEIDEVLKRHNLQSAEFEALSTLRIVDPPYELTPTDLYRTILLTSGGMTKVIKRLEAAGLVTLSTSAEDGRSKLIRLTKAGKKLIEAAMKDAIHAEVSVLSRAFSESQRARVGQLLNQGLHRLGEE